MAREIRRAQIAKKVARAVFKIRFATTRAIRHAQSAERVAREYVAVKKPGATERRLT